MVPPDSGYIPSEVAFSNCLQFPLVPQTKLPLKFAFEIAFQNDLLKLHLKLPLVPQAKLPLNLLLNLPFNLPFELPFLDYL